MHRNTRFAHDLSKVISGENSVQKGGREPHDQPRLPRGTDGIQTTDVSEKPLEDETIVNPGRPDLAVPPKGDTDQDKTEKPYRGSTMTKTRQPNIAGMRRCLPLAQWLFEDLLLDLVCEVTTAAFQRSKKDFVDAYLAEVAFRHCASDIVSEVVQLLLPGLVEEAQLEKAVDDVIEAELLPEVIAVEARAAALSELADHDNQVAIQQLTQVRWYASNRLMDVYLMGHLAQLVASQGRCFAEKELSRRLLDSWMLDVLSHQLFNVLRLRNITIENAPLRNYHRRIFTDIALDVILSELSESLDEDMEHWLEYERQMEEGPG